eukprot:g4248.t1
MLSSKEKQRALFNLQSLDRKDSTFLRLTAKLRQVMDKDFISKQKQGSVPRSLQLPTRRIKKKKNNETAPTLAPPPPIISSSVSPSYVSPSPPRITIPTSINEKIIRKRKEKLPEEHKITTEAARRDHNALVNEALYRYSEDNRKILEKEEIRRRNGLQQQMLRPGVQFFQSINFPWNGASLENISIPPTLVLNVVHQTSAENKYFQHVLLTTRKPSLCNQKGILKRTVFKGNALRREKDLISVLNVFFGTKDKDESESRFPIALLKTVEGKLSTSSSSGILPLYTRKEATRWLRVFMGRSEPAVLQGYIKPKGKSPWFIRSVWRLQSPQFSWLISSKEPFEIDETESLVSGTTREKNAVLSLTEEMETNNNDVSNLVNITRVVKKQSWPVPKAAVAEIATRLLEKRPNQIDLLACDFVLDDEDKWWFIGTKAIFPKFSSTSFVTIGTGNKSGKKSKGKKSSTQISRLEAWRRKGKREREQNVNCDATVVNDLSLNLNEREKRKICKGDYCNAENERTNYYEISNFVILEDRENKKASMNDTKGTKLRRQRNERYQTVKVCHDCYRIYSDLTVARRLRLKSEKKSKHLPKNMKISSNHLLGNTQQRAEVHAKRREDRKAKIEHDIREERKKESEVRRKAQRNARLTAVSVNPKKAAIVLYDSDDDDYEVKNSVYSSKQIAARASALSPRNRNRRRNRFDEDKNVYIGSQGAYKNPLQQKLRRPYKSSTQRIRRFTKKWRGKKRIKRKTKTIVDKRDTIIGYGNMPATRKAPDVPLRVQLDAYTNTKALQDAETDRLLTRLAMVRALKQEKIRRIQSRHIPIISE